MSTEFCASSNFSDFLSSKNIPSLAIGSVIGLSIASLSNSLSTDIVVPITSFFFRKDITTAHIQLKRGNRDIQKNPYDTYMECRDDKGAINLMYGKFMSMIINLLIQILIVYGLVRSFCYSRKAINKAIDIITPVTKGLVST